jgi:hypothetical protein
MEFANAVVFFVPSWMIKDLGVVSGLFLGFKL